MVIMWPVRSSRCTSRRSTRTTTPITRSQAERYTPSTLSAKAGRATSISSAAHATLKQELKGASKLKVGANRGPGDDVLGRIPVPGDVVSSMEDVEVALRRHVTTELRGQHQARQRVHDVDGSCARFAIAAEGHDLVG